MSITMIIRVSRLRAGPGPVRPSGFGQPGPRRATADPGTVEAAPPGDMGAALAGWAAWALRTVLYWRPDDGPGSAGSATPSLASAPAAPARRLHESHVVA